MLAQHADVVIARLEDPEEYAEQLALDTLGKLPEPATFRHQVYAELARFSAATFKLAATKKALLCILPRFGFVTQGDGLDSTLNMRSRLLGRLAWYRFRLRRCVQCLALYWYALP